MRIVNLQKNKFKCMYPLTVLSIAEKVMPTICLLKRKMEDRKAVKAEIEALKHKLSDDEIISVRKCTI